MGGLLDGVELLLSASDGEARCLGCPKTSRDDMFRVSILPEGVSDVGHFFLLVVVVTDHLSPLH